MEGRKVITEGKKVTGIVEGRKEGYNGRKKEGFNGRKEGRL
jgi:hypothetical protein